MYFSIAFLDQIYAVCKEHDAFLIVDDAHGIGVLGINLIKKGDIPILGVNAINNYKAIFEVL